MSLARLLVFVVQLGVCLVVSISLWPIVPWWLAPPLIVLLVVALAIGGHYSASTRWAIWGGLAIDLLSPGWFGVRWLSILTVALLVRDSRRLVAIRELPWLWPVWFGIATIVFELPMSLLTHHLTTMVPAMVSTAAWGTLVVAVSLWFAQSPASTR